MYNRYFDPEACAPAEPDPPRPAGRENASLLSALLGGGGASAPSLSGLPGWLSPDGGDLFLPLLCYGLYRESGDPEWLILLVLLLLTGL